MQGGLNLNTNRISKYQIENFTKDVIEEVKNELKLKDIFPTTTKGDLVVDDGTVINRLGVGSDGQVLIGDSASSTGLNWLDFSLVNLNSIQVRRTNNFVVNLSVN